MTIRDWLKALFAMFFVKTPVPVGPVGNVEAALLKLHNAERSKVGLAPLTLDARLTAAAERHAMWMAKVDKLDHMHLGDGDPWTRIAEAGYVGSSESENIGEDEIDPAEAVYAWMQSPPHKMNVLGKWVHMGAAMARGPKGDPYWCVDFGRP